MGCNDNGSCGCDACDEQQEGSAYAQALGFGMLSARHAGGSRFWQAAMAADIARRGPWAGEDCAVARSIRQTMEFNSHFAHETGAMWDAHEFEASASFRPLNGGIIAQGEPWHRPPLLPPPESPERAQAERRVEIWRRVTDRVYRAIANQVLHVTPGPGSTLTPGSMLTTNSATPRSPNILDPELPVWYPDWTPNAECCVDRFDFPVPDSVEYVRGINTVGFRFDFGARYVDDPPCECQCCYYKQFVRVDLTVPGIGEIPASDTSEPEGVFVEDCVALKANGDEEPCPKGGRAEPGETYKVYRPRSGTQTESTGGDTGTCEWTQSDEPKYGPVLVWDRFEGNWQFLGVIYDVCNAWQIVSVQGFQAEIVKEAWLGPSRGRWRPLVPYPGVEAWRRMING